jgi:coatomer protein complex subunit gamma
VLRRLVYLGIKELSNIAEDVIIVTSSLTKDMTGKEDCYRAAAIRALCTITDPVMLQVCCLVISSVVTVLRIWIRDPVPF